MCSIKHFPLIVPKFFFFFFFHTLVVFYFIYMAGIYYWRYKELGNTKVSGKEKPSFSSSSN